MVSEAEASNNPESYLAAGTDPSYLNSEIYRYIAIEEFARLVKESICRFTRISDFQDPWEGMNDNQAIAAIDSGNNMSLAWANAIGTRELISNKDKDLQLTWAAMGNLNYEQLQRITDEKSTSKNPINTYKLKKSPNTKTLSEIKRQTYAWCWTLNSPDKMNMWQSYAATSSYLCLRTTPRDVIKSLNLNSKFRVGKVSYEELVTDDYLDVAFQKTNSYSHEREFRFVQENASVLQESASHLYNNFAIPKDLTIFLHPLAMYSYKSLIEEICSTEDRGWNIESVRVSRNHNS
jgi:hypothetical protein